MPQGQVVSGPDCLLVRFSPEWLVSRVCPGHIVFKDDYLGHIVLLLLGYQPEEATMLANSIIELSVCTLSQLLSPGKV